MRLSIDRWANHRAKRQAGIVLCFAMLFVSSICRGHYLAGSAPSGAVNGFWPTKMTISSSGKSPGGSQVRSGEPSDCIPASERMVAIALRSNRFIDGGKMTKTPATTLAFVAGGYLTAMPRARSAFAICKANIAASASLTDMTTNSVTLPRNAFKCSNWSGVNARGDIRSFSFASSKLASAARALAVAADSNAEAIFSSLSFNAPRCKMMTTRVAMTTAIAAAAATPNDQTTIAHKCKPSPNIRLSFLDKVLFAFCGASLLALLAFAMWSAIDYFKRRRPQ